MQHRVTQNLVLRASAAGTREWSRSIAIGQDNTATFEVTLRSAAVTPITLTTKLMGSNDLENWTFITQTVANSVPSLTRVDGLDTLPWKYLRADYTATHATLTPNVMIAASITTSRRD